MPNCFGAIHGKHILLRCPPNSGSLFFNYKKQFSIVLMAASDDLYRFTLVDIGAYGGNSDGGIFECSNIGKSLKNNQLHLPITLGRLPNSDNLLPGYFLADSAFPLSSNLMKPYSGNNLSKEQKIYNYRLSRARRTIESAFGIFANRWRVFHTPICLLPQTTEYLILTSVCLHNYIMREEQNDHLKNYSQNWQFRSDERYEWIINTRHHYDSNVTAAINQRDILCQYLNSSGSVSFQTDYIHPGQYSEY
ncbi:uncharacterized protein [Prorops nasuta]|uniref:uncharacterized protein n=1 Tax=Prorops nasuta TaxID=863751 RepID=UPI0034CE17A2